jgi:hypothetical protein
MQEMQARNKNMQATGRIIQPFYHSASIAGKKSEKSEKSPVQPCFLPGSL